MEAKQEELMSTATEYTKCKQCGYEFGVHEFNCRTCEWEFDCMGCGYALYLSGWTGDDTLVKKWLDHCNEFGVKHFTNA
jgi:hypothetical protein